MQASADVGAKGIAQIFVDHIEVKPLWVEMSARPAKMGFAVSMLRVEDRLEEITVGPRSSDILGRPGAGNFHALGMAGQGTERQPSLDPDHMVQSSLKS